MSLESDSSYEFLFLLIFSCLTAGGIYLLYRYHELYQFIVSKSQFYKPHTMNKLKCIVVSSFKESVNGIICLMNRKPLAFRIVGLDCERTSDSVNGGHPVPATLQLASHDGFCSIFQVKVMEKSEEKNNQSLYSKFYPSSIKILSQVLEDSNILKVGVAVIEDAKYLEESYGLMSKGCLDIRYVAQQLGIEPTGLQDLGLKVLGVGKKEVKKEKGRTTKWENEVLSQSQIDYAAHDARLGVDIFMKLNDQEICRRYSLIRRLFWDEETYWRHTVELWEVFIGQRFDLKKEDKGILCDKWKRALTLNRFCQGSVFRYAILESALNMKWCAVCGIENVNQVRLKTVVPVDYNIGSVDNRPQLYLCKECFDRSRQEDYILREELTEQCGAPYPDYQHVQLVKAKQIAEDIYSNKERTEQLELKEYRLCELLGLSHRQLTLETLETILSMDCWPGSAHGQFVGDYFESFNPNGTEGLKNIWWERFYSTMKPRYYPVYY